MSPYSEPPLAAPSHRPVISDLVKDDVGNSSFTITFTAGQELPTHRNASRILIQVLQGHGVVSVDGGPPEGVVVGDQVQVPPRAPHALTAGDDGLVVQVHLVPDCCSCC